MIALRAKDVLPHRGPWLQVDEVLEQNDDFIVCRRTFDPESLLLQGHFPQFPVVPGVVLCEFGMQSGAIQLSEFVIGKDENTIPIVISMDEVRFRKPVFPGDTLTAKAEVVDHRGGIFRLRSRIYRDSQMVARLEYACKLIPAD